MKKFLLSFWVLVLTVPVFSQMLTVNPAFLTESSTPVTIVLDASKGNRALYNFSSGPEGDGVFVHIGVITNLSTTGDDWRYVRPGSFNQPNAALRTVITGTVPNLRYTFTISGGIRSFFGVPAGETIQKIAILFRNANGSKVQRNADGSNMFIPVNNGNHDLVFTSPGFQPTYNPIPEPIVRTVGSTLAVTAVANLSGNMRVLHNGNQIGIQPSGTIVSSTASITVAGMQTILAESVSGGNTVTKSFSFFVPATTEISDLPAGVRQGINYDADQTAATLVLYAPNKTRVSIIGDFPGSNWQEQLAYQMKKTPDNNYYWLRVTGLTPGTEYAYQYLVDGTLKIGEPYAEKILDPWNDQYINSATYPALKPYPNGLTTGITGVLQTASPAYTWQTTNYTRPDKRNLMVYELLLRDFIERHDWNGMTDTLNYLKKLGINTIQLMPINEFEGNISWGYNPDYYFAPDKYYGPKNDLKRFIDMAHSRGIAVVLDIALNHSFGLSPMVQMYWDATNSRPAADNPWFNPVAKHAYNVGYDMNHSTAATNYFFSRVVEHWLTEYKVDGFRFDLSKGFTQNQTCDGNGNNCDEGAMANYDASRIAIWKKYYDTLQLKSPGSYVILEHFATNSEELELSNYRDGMLLWGNLNYNFSEAAMGWIGSSNFDGALHVNRGWSNPHLVSYMESHDEERLMFKNINYGNQTNPAHNTRSLPVALGRMGMSAAFLLTMPGPKMIWQFGEMGYGFSINRCGDGSINDACRTDAKPIEWGYLQVPERKALHDVYANLLKLRANPLYAATFTTGVIDRNLSGAFKWMTINSPAGKLVVIGNFDVVAQTGSVTFPAAGAWYNYLNPSRVFNATGASQSFTLQPGEYRVYLNTLVALPVSVTSFTGQLNGSDNLLNWKAENEINFSRYELQRSTDGRNFTSIATINGTGAGSYQYTDVNVASPINFYRLKLVDIDGAYSYSTVVRLAGAVEKLSVAANPNPFGASLKLSISSPVKETGVLVLTDLSGRILLRKNVNLLQGVNTFEVDELSSLSAGAYILNLVAAQNKTSIKVVKASK